MKKAKKKLFKPSHHFSHSSHSYGHSYGHSPSYSSHHKLGAASAAVGAYGAAKVGKKILGTAVKLQIAKFAFKFGIEAAKEYFEYKLGRKLEYYIIDKFMRRYHSQRTRSYRRYHKRKSSKKKDLPQQQYNVTLG